MCVKLVFAGCLFFLSFWVMKTVSLDARVRVCSAQKRTSLAKKMVMDSLTTFVSLLLSTMTSAQHHNQHNTTLLFQSRKQKENAGSALHSGVDILD